MSAEPRISIRLSTEEDHAAIADIANALSPDQPPLTVERYRAALRSQPPEASAQSFVAEVGSHVVGRLWLNRLIYVPNPHRATCGVIGLFDILENESIFPRLAVQDRDRG